MGAADRFQVVPTPYAAPGECLICKSIRQAPFVDVRADIFGYGVVYICKGCVLGMYNAVADVEVASIEERISFRLAEEFNKGFIEGIHTLQESISDTAQFYLDSRSPSAVQPSAAGTIVPEPEAVPTDPEGEDGSGEGSNSTGKQVKRSAKREGPSGVSGDSSNGSADADESVPSFNV